MREFIPAVILVLIMFVGLIEYYKTRTELDECKHNYVKRLENNKFAIDKWNGAYPQTYLGGNGSIPLINIKDQVKASSLNEKGA